MNLKITWLLAVFSVAFSGSAVAAGAKTYEVTGTVLEATGSKVTIQKGTERWEIDIDPATTKGSADLKVGSTVTVTYVMSAMKIAPSASSTAPAENPPPPPASASPAD